MTKVVTFDLHIGLAASANLVLNLFIHNKNPLVEKVKIIRAIAYYPSSKASLEYCFSSDAKAKVEKDIKRYESILAKAGIYTTEEALTFLEDMHLIGKTWKQAKDAEYERHRKKLNQIKTDYLNSYK